MLLPLKIPPVYGRSAALGKLQENYRYLVQRLSRCGAYRLTVAPHTNDKALYGCRAASIGSLHFTFVFFPMTVTPRRSRAPKRVPGGPVNGKGCGAISGSNRLSSGRFRSFEAFRSTTTARTAVVDTHLRSSGERAPFRVY